MPVSVARPVRRQHGPRTRGGARGLEVSPCGFLQDQLVQRQVRDRPAKPRVLSLQFLQPLDLIALQPAVLVAPAIICNFVQRVNDPPDRSLIRLTSYRPHRIRDRAALCHQHIHLPQLRDDLFRRMPFPCHRTNPPWSKPYFREDHFKGGRSHDPVVSTRQGVREAENRRVVIELRGHEENREAAR